MWVINALLYVIFNIASLTVSIGATMLEFTLDPVAFTGLFNLKAVYDLWKMVRDFFNLFFILMILFIAFATIFQVQAYNYKKLLWQLVLMALLVNFSFPVSRFIIDAANVPMYFFLNSIAPDSTTGAGGRLASSFFTAAQLKAVLLPAGIGFNDSLKGGWDLSIKILQATIFVFIFGISVMSLAILLFIRAVTLLALVIFSPVGFIGTAIPWFSSLANDWWKKLLSNAFFGPTAALMLLVAVKIMQAFNADNTTQTALNAIAQKNSASMVSSINLASLTVFAVPIIFIWMSITVGKSFGIAGADKVIGSAQKFAKSTGKRAFNAATFGRVEYAQKSYKEYKKERESRSNAKFAANNVGTKLGKATNAKLDQISASRTKEEGSWTRPWQKLDPRRETAAARQARMRSLNYGMENVNKAAKENLLEHESDDGMKMRYKRVKDGIENDKNVRAAVVRESIGRGIDVEQKDIDQVKKDFGEVGGITSMVSKEIDKKLMEKDPLKAFSTGGGGYDFAAFRKAIVSGKVDREKISAQAWKNPELVRIMNEEKKLDSKFLLDLGKKNSEAADNIASSVGAEIARTQVGRGTFTSDKAKAFNRLHTMYVAKEGTFHGTAIDADKSAFFKKADYDSMKNMTAATLAGNAAIIANNMNAQQFATTMSKLAQEGTDVSELKVAIDELKKPLNANATKVRDAWVNDNRLNTL